MSVDVVVSVLIPILTPILTGVVLRWWSQRRKYAIELRVEVRCIFLKLIERIPHCIRNGMVLDDTRIGDLVQYVLILRNTGSKPIEGKYVSKPMSWTGGGHICAAWVDRTRPADCVDLRLAPSGNVLEVTWELFNQGCKAEIGVLCQRGEELGVGTVVGRIRNVRRIKVRGVSTAEKMRRVLFGASVAYSCYFLFLTLSRNIGVGVADASVPMSIVFYGSLVYVSVFTYRLFGRARDQVLSWRATGKELPSRCV